VALGHQRGVGESPHLGPIDGDAGQAQSADQVGTGVVPVTEAVHHRRHLSHPTVDDQGQHRTTLEGGRRGRTDQGQLECTDRGGDRTGLAGGQLLDALAVIEDGGMVDDLTGHPVQ
jgi:hypothetical protein